jgi:KUP system potassium uptake protein
MLEKESPVKGIIKSMGLVFGDIGTSPIYTLSVIFLLTPATETNIIGILSLIVWTLVILVTVEYAWLAMSLGKKGEGGTIVLREILLPLLKSGRAVGFVTILSFIGVSLLIGDGIITPSISILSAVEGMLLIPGLEATSTRTLVLIAAAIAVALFVFQKKGTEKIAGAFGPLMIIWFLTLSVSGVVSILHVPSVIKAVNPYYALKFLYENGITGFFVLSSVILCATGAEALYADMGHLGRQPILRAWYFVFCALLLTYLGQGAFLIQNPGAKNVLFSMVFNQAQKLYIPFLILSIIATIIASQAMISAMFSIVYQSINTRIMPMFKIDYTSIERRSQIYIASVNWFLLVCVLFIMYEFKESHKLAAAYGLAVTGVITLTGIFLTWIFYLQKKPALSIISFFVAIIDIAYLSANFYKIPHGGYWSLILASIPFLTIALYTQGQKRLYKMMNFMPLDEFLHKFKRVYATAEEISGTALFLIRNVNEIPFYITQTMFFHGIIYKDNIFLSIVKRDDPFGITGFFKERIAEGIRVFEIQFGYLEVIDVEEIMREAGIAEKTIFYGIEHINTKSAVWKIFSTIKKLSPPLVQFYKLPSRKLHGVLTRIEM